MLLATGGPHWGHLRFEESFAQGEKLGYSNTINIDVSIGIYDRLLYELLAKGLQNQQFNSICLYPVVYPVVSCGIQCRYLDWACPQKTNVDGGWPALLFTAVGLDHLKFVGKALIFSFANHLPHVRHYYSKYPDSNRDNIFRRSCTVVHWTIFKWEGLTLDLHRENWLLVNQPLSSSNEERSRHQHCHPGAHRGRDVLLRGTVCWGQIGENITRKS